ncbi:OLC1v1019251C1, partial [Oldenlandia corymbosa var. corymbosa]
MLHKMKQPPKSFEDFVAPHFFGLGESMLADITTYTNGDAILVQYTKEAIVGPTVLIASNLGDSKKFESNMSKILSDFKSALRTPNHSIKFLKTGNKSVKRGKKN